MGGYRESVLRTALKPRWLALLALVIVVASGMARLGQWQLDRARANSRPAQQALLEREPVPLTGVFPPRTMFPGTGADLPVTVSGTWDTARQFLVTPRRAATGETEVKTLGYWVLTPLRLDDGSAVGVVRGWVRSADDPAVSPAGLPTGRVDVTGILQQADLPSERRPGEPSHLPAGQLDKVDMPHLIEVWPYPLYTGYIVLTAQSPASTGPSLQAVTVTPPSGGYALQNLSYAAQWFLFAGFGLFFWYRVVREDHRADLASAGTTTPGTTTPGAGAPEPVGDDEQTTPAVGGTHP